MNNLFPNATPEQKFILMLQERVDSLTDELNKFRKHFPSQEEIPNNVYIKDHNIACNKLFIIIHLDNKESCQKIIDFIQNYEYFDTCKYDLRETSLLFRDNGIDVVPIIPEYDFDYQNPASNIPKDNHTLQVLVRFQCTIYASSFMMKIYEIVRDAVKNIDAHKYNLLIRVLQRVLESQEITRPVYIT